MRGHVSRAGAAAPGRRPAAGLVLLLTATCAVGTGGPAVADHPLVLVSVGAGGGQGAGPSGTYGVSVSADGSTVAFGSTATGLSDADPDREADVYVRDLDSAGAVLASTSAGDRVKASTFSLRPSLDAAGDTVAFMSAASNLSTDDSDSIADVFVKDLRTRGIVLASTAPEGEKGNADSSSPALSGDGRRVAFVSRATNLSDRDTDSAPDVYVKDLLTQAVVLVSRGLVGPEHAPGPYGMGTPSISADGLTVAFDTDAALVAQDDDTAPDVYVADVASGRLRLASVSLEDRNSDGGSYRPSLSADGRSVAFDSYSADLAPGDTSEDGDVFVKDLGTGVLEVASTQLDGTGVEGRATDASLSADGRRVAFASDAPLGPLPTASLQTWVKDLDSGVVQLVSTDAAGTPAASGTIAPRLSADGTVVTFTTTAPLTAADRNGWADVYARRLGGAPPPPPPPPPPPSEDTAPPSLSLVASADTITEDDVVTLTGVATDDGSGLASVDFTVVDEYGRVSPVLEPVTAEGGATVEWTRTLSLPGRVRPWDVDGREFTIWATATDVSGNTACTHVHVVALHPRELSTPVPVDPVLTSR